MIQTSFREEAQQTLAKRKVERLKRAVISHRQPKEHVFNILCHAVNVCDDATYFHQKINEDLQIGGLDVQAEEIIDIIDGYKGKG
ncbi:uncharacterized protein [Pocillopora verrucosa]|uniref:uncharacterized protein isoform X3 n=1 Tax=Pocillopora verrucosa TaxID=203993 RepID=UPI00333E3A80